MKVTKKIKAGVWVMLCVLFVSPLFAEEQELYAPYKIKAQFIGGVLYPHNKDLIAPLVKGPMLGAELAFEWAMDGSKPWHYHFNKPDIGLALQAIDLGNPEVTGQMIALYPYINIPLYKNKIISFNTKIGCGLAYATKPCDINAAAADPRTMEEKAADYNFAIGGPVDVAASAALNIDVRLHKNVLFTADVSFSHFSSGNLYQPNYGLNLFNGYVGLKYVPVYKKAPAPLDSIPALTKRWSGEIVLSGGARKLYYSDTRHFGIASLNVEGYYRTCHQHRVGVGLDLFFSDAYGQTVASDENGNYQWTNEFTHLTRTCTAENKFSNKLRFGFNIANELTIHKVGIFFHVGMYLYDPVKDMEPGEECLEALNSGSETKKKGLLYAYDIQKEDGWCYFRLGVRYHITKHFLVNASVKTHLQKVEFAEFGVGYAF